MSPMDHPDRKAPVAAFLLRAALFASPLLLVLGAYLVLDPFRVLREYDDPSQGSIVDLNKDHVGTRTYLRRYEAERYDAFLFGSSRTLGFRIEDWSRHLSPGSVPFAFDANQESLYGIGRKVRLIDSLGGTLRYALIIVDPLNTFAPWGNSEGHLFMKDPVLSGESAWTFQKTFVRAWFSRHFFVKYLDHRITGARRAYMSGALVFDGRNRYDPVSMERLMPVEAVIQADPDRYYREHAGLFPARDTSAQQYYPAMLGPDHRRGLEEIAAILHRHGTRVDVIVAPLYDQRAIAPEDLEQLREVFGAAHTYDRSGINTITRDVRNYIESSHFRAHVGRQLMDEVYGPALPPVREGDPGPPR